MIKRLQRKGFTAVAPPNLLRGPATDAPYLASYLRSISGPIVLVAHSYGGFVATNAATGNGNVKALVYIDAFAPDEGETAGELVARGGSCVGSAFNVVPYDGSVDLYLLWEASASYPGFMECFANGVDRDEAAVLFAMQRPADDPVVVADRDAGPRDPARARSSSARPCSGRWRHCFTAAERQRRAPSPSAWRSPCSRSCCVCYRRCSRTRPRMRATRNTPSRLQGCFSTLLSSA